MPEVGELIAHAFGGAHDAEKLLAFERVGDGGVDGGPNVPGLFVDGELVEHEVGGVTAGGVGIGGDGDDAGLVGEGDLGARHQCVATGAGLVVGFQGELDGFGPLPRLAHPLDGLAFARREHHPQRVGMEQTVEHRLGGGGEGLAGLTRPQPNLEAGIVEHPLHLVGHEDGLEDGLRRVHLRPKMARILARRSASVRVSSWAASLAALRRRSAASNFSR